jgi:metallophosphoesterase superfamily enzyme
MHTGCEEWEMKVEVFGGEHPLVVDGNGEREQIPCWLLVAVLTETQEYLP